MLLPHVTPAPLHVVVGITASHEASFCSVPIQSTRVRMTGKFSSIGNPIIATAGEFKIDVSNVVYHVELPSGLYPSW